MIGDVMDDVRKRIKELEEEVSCLTELQEELTALRDALATYDGHQLSTKKKKSSPARSPARSIPSCGGYEVCGGCGTCREGPNYR